MPVYIARKTNMAFNEGRGLRKNAETIIFTFTFEFFGRNLVSLQNRTFLKKCNIEMYYRCTIQVRAKFKFGKHVNDWQLWYFAGIWYIRVAAHLRGMRPNLTSKKDTLMLRRNSNILPNLHYNSIMYFNWCAYIRIRI